jgi:hypothetical protein
MRDTQNTRKKVKDKTSGKRRETKRERERERLFKNCFSLLGLLFVVN